MTGRNGKREPLGEIFTRDFIMLSIINLSVFFGFQMLNVGLPVYMAQLGATAQIVGLATTLMTVTATLVRVFTGALLDRFGRWGMLIGGTAIMVCAITSFAIFPIVGVILGLRLVHGIGWGVGSTASSTIAADIIPKHRFAEGMGYFAITTAIASAIGPATSIALVQGAGSAFMVYTAAGVTALALVLAVVEMLISKRKNSRFDTPAPEGSPVRQGGSKPNAADSEPLSPAPADGSEKPGSAPQLQATPPSGATSPANQLSPQARSASPGTSPAGASPQPRQYSKLETLFERRAIVASVLIFFVNIGFGCITTFIALHADEQGVSGVSAYFIVYAIVTLASRPYIGKLIDRHGYRIPAILSSVCMAATLVLIGISSNIWMFAGAGVIGGLGIGTSMGTFQSMAVASVEPWRRGVATSTYMTAFDLGIALGSLIGGAVAGIAGYTVMYCVIALFPLIACIISAVVVKKGAGVKASATPQDGTH